MSGISSNKATLDRLYPLTEINKSKHTPRFGQKVNHGLYSSSPVSFLFKNISSILQSI